jgi:hypothetical protein
MTTRTPIGWRRRKAVTDATCELFRLEPAALAALADQLGAEGAAGVCADQLRTIAAALAEFRRNAPAARQQD